MLENGYLLSYFLLSVLTHRDYSLDYSFLELYPPNHPLL